MRLFVAVYPPPAAVTDLASCVGRLALGQPREPGRAVRAVPPDRWHLTLAFLGEVAEQREPVARAAVEAAAREATLPELRLGGAGRFGKGRFTTVWIGVRGETAVLTGLSKAVRRELRRGKLPFDDKPFRPHLTLGRPGDRLSAAELAADLAALDEYEGPPWRVQAVELVRSQPGPKPRYDRLAAFPLGT